MVGCFGLLASSTMRRGAPGASSTRRTGAAGAPATGAWLGILTPRRTRATREDGSGTGGWERRGPTGAASESGAGASIRRLRRQGTPSRGPGGTQSVKETDFEPLPIGERRKDRSEKEKALCGRFFVKSQGLPPQPFDSDRRDGG
jgi:hypothetical protein